MIINVIAEKMKFALTTSIKIMIFPKNPVRGGIPAIEKRIIAKEKDHNEFN